MSHYFETPTASAARHTVHATIWDRDYEFSSAPGVFSAHRLDIGTRVLFRSTNPPRRAENLLDLGCGFGPIAIALATECPSAHVDAVDVNNRALELTQDNAQALGVSDRVSAVNPHDALAADIRYDEIWSNPPIRIGKQALHDLLLTWLPRLRDEGSAFLVVGKNLGADSLQSWLADNNWATERVASAKGFRVFQVSRPDH